MRRSAPSPSQISAILVELIAASRNAGQPDVPRDQLIQCGLGTYELRSASASNVACKDLRSVWACNLLRHDRPADLGRLMIWAN